MGNFTQAVLAQATHRGTVPGRDPTTDREMLARYAAGDQDAFAALVRRHAPLVLGVCRRALSDEHAAEDAAQATFLLLAERAGRGGWHASVANWLHAAARRVAGNVRAADGRRRVREARAAVPEAVSPIDTMTARELLAVLDEELARLPEKYRGPLILCHLEGLPYDTAASRLGVTEGCLRGRLQRGRRRLADALSGRGLGAAGGLAAVAAAGRGDAASLADGVLAAIAATPRAAPPAGRWAVLAALGCVTVAVLAAAGLPGGQPPAPKKPAAAKQAGVTVTGRVLRPDGKPAPGAAVFAMGLKRPGPPTDENITLKRVGTAGEGGRFRVSVVPMSARRSVYMTASAAGCGMAFFEFEGGRLDGEVTFRLVKDVPITGRVVSTEGRPVSGVRAEVELLRLPQGGSLDGILARWREGSARDAFRAGESKIGPIGPTAGKAVTGKDGRFTVRGVGAERAALLTLSGGGVATTTAYVLTREGLDAAPLRKALARPENAELQSLNLFQGPFEPNFTIVLRRGAAAAGVVTDAKTGRPVPGVLVTSQAGPTNTVQALSDADGRFRLDGLPAPPGGRYFVTVKPPADSTYLPRTLRPAAEPVSRTLRLDVKLRRGVVVTGRVTDSGTGRGVGSVVTAVPLRGNKFAGLSGRGPSFPNQAQTDEAGRFRIVTTRGLTMLAAYGYAPARLHGEHVSPFRRAAPDPQHRSHFFPTGTGSWYVRAAGGGGDVIGRYNVVRVIDVATEGTADVDLRLGRGGTSRVEFRGPGGKPLAGPFVVGLTDYGVGGLRPSGSTSGVLALDPKKPRSVFAYHAAKKVAGSVPVTAERPAVLRLAPEAALKGRLRDKDGLPLVGVRVTVMPADPKAGELYREEPTLNRAVRTDAAGRFTSPPVVPGMRFRVALRRGTKFYRLRPRVGTLILKPGEARELGDLVAEPVN